MAKRLLVLTLVTVGLALALPGAGKRTTQGDWVYLQNGPGVRISIETNRAKAGWTPVIVSMAGAEVSAVMDENGRVVRVWATGLDRCGPTLFPIELERGCVLLGREAHAIMVYEQNPIRTRLRFVENVLQVPARIDPQGKAGKLMFGGLEIPAQVSEVDSAALGSVVSPKGAKTGPGAIRPTGLAANRPAGRASAPLISRGFGAKAQLIPSHIRVRGK